MKIFSVFETYDERFSIEVSLDNLDDEMIFYFTSSYNVVAARLLGFTYPDFLRFCRSNGAKLEGRAGYTHPVWSNRNECQKICNLLNKEWEKFQSLI